MGAVTVEVEAVMTRMTDPHPEVVVVEVLEEAPAVVDLEVGTDTAVDRPRIAEGKIFSATLLRQTKKTATSVLLSKYLANALLKGYDEIL